MIENDLIILTGMNACDIIMYPFIFFSPNLSQQQFIE